MKEVLDLIREVEESGFIPPKIGRQETDIIIGTIKGDEKAKMIHSLAVLYRREGIFLQEKGLKWQSLLFKIRAAMCMNAFMERVVSLFGEKAQEKAGRKSFDTYSVDVRGNWEVVITPKE